eukprot:COSAG04_NODE_270_length_18507_cov_125.250380_10_plen_192_part_00
MQEMISKSQSRWSSTQQRGRSCSKKQSGKVCTKQPRICPETVKGRGSSHLAGGGEVLPQLRSLLRRTLRLRVRIRQLRPGQANHGHQSVVQTNYRSYQAGLELHFGKPIGRSMDLLVLAYVRSVFASSARAVSAAVAAAAPLCCASATAFSSCRKGQNASAETVSTCVPDSGRKGDVFGLDVRYISDGAVS